MPILQMKMAFFSKKKSLLNRINLDTKAYKTGRIVMGIYKYNIKGPIDFIEVKI